MLTFVSDDASVTMSHCLNPRLVEAQAAALRLPLIKKRVNWNTYERGFQTALEELKAKGVDTLITGDIDLPEGIAWNRKMCRELGLKLLMPLENVKPDRVVTGFVNAGYRAVIVCVNSSTPASEWLGDAIHVSFLARVRSEEARTVHVCGEMGEFHTLVTDGPIFAESIEVIEGKPVEIDGYSYLDISRYEVKAKEGRCSHVR
jgi:uncharacterized protein (TIGR00290 family)